MGKKQTQNSSKNKDRVAEFYKISSAVMSKVGIIGFVCISFVAYVFYFVPQDKKNEVTDTWLLFKCKECNYVYILFLLSLCVLFVFQNYFYRKAIKLKDARIREISKEKSDLQEKLLNKKLNSTEE